MNGWNCICTCCHKLCAAISIRITEKRASWWVQRSSCCRASIVPAYESKAEE